MDDGPCESSKMIILQNSQIEYGGNKNNMYEIAESKMDSVIQKSGIVGMHGIIGGYVGSNGSPNYEPGYCVMPGDDHRECISAFI